jgi:predicted O-methyltransferase YrrM
VDLFVGASNTDQPAERARSHVAKACGGAPRLRILVADSMELTADRLTDKTRVKSFRFISIDGGHTAEIVHRDLETCYPLLTAGGIIALDDVFNWITPGVLEGVAKFFLERKPALAPFAQCYNKLFVTTPEFHGRYLAAAQQFLEEVSWLPMHRNTRENWRLNKEGGFTPRLFGYEIAPFV